MKKLFLSSSFSDVADLLSEFAGEDLKGKTVTFIPTASLPETIKFYVKTGRKALEKLGLLIDELEITKSSKTEIISKFQNNHYIYISGGNTFFLLQEIKKSGVDKVILEQINKGKLFIGESAGSMIMAPNIDYVKDMDDSKKAKDLDNNSALNVIDFYPLPHYKNFPFKRSVDRIIAKFSSELRLYPIKNSQVILVAGKDIKVKTNK